MATNSENSSVLTDNRPSSPSSGDEQTVRQETVYTIADLGIRSRPQTQQTVIGPVIQSTTDLIPEFNVLFVFLLKTRSLSSLSRPEWVYVTTSLVSLLVVFGLTAERLISLSSSDTDFTFAFLLSWTTIFCFVYVTQVSL